MKNIQSPLPIIKLIIKVGNKYALKLKVKLITKTCTSFGWEIYHKNNLILCGNYVYSIGNKDTFEKMIDNFIKKHHIKQLCLNEQTYNV